MARINLVPWRQERRKQREREFYLMLAMAAVAAVGVVVLVIAWMGYRVDEQVQRNAYLQSEIKALDKQIEEIKELDKTREQLLGRKGIIEQLESNRSQMVHLFDDMVRTIPDGVRLLSMKQTGNKLTLEGVAESNSSVANYMRNIDNSPWMGNSDLRKIENKVIARDADKKMPYAFSLDAKLREPGAQDSVAEPPADKPSTAPVRPPARTSAQEKP
ncbi:MAG: PilN domain-containing protein [Rhodanobacter sp.]|jgi:type IV pilus assembly protein PilN|nr:PilN domain-containing protein [Rhodanobacter sp.]